MGKRQLLEQIEKAMKSCRECRLWRTRTNVVPGEGNPNAKVMFVGQCPGFNEDKLGRPFVGRAGDLLEELLISANLKRKEVFITNIIHCQPPGNRDPMVDEVRACKAYLDEQIKTINPKLIVPLGRFAMEHFLKSVKISKDHGIPKKVGGRIVFPLYHPAAALRSLEVEKELRADFKKILKILSGEIKAEEVKVQGENKNQISLFKNQ